MEILGYSLLQLGVFLVLGLAFGALAQSLAGYSPAGCLISLVLGTVGALLGAWVASQLALPPVFTLTWFGESFSLLWSAIGAAIFAFVLSLLLQRLIVDL